MSRGTSFIWMSSDISIAINQVNGINLAEIADLGRIIRTEMHYEGNTASIFLHVGNDL